MHESWRPSIRCPSNWHTSQWQERTGIDGQWEKFAQQKSREGRRKKDDDRLKKDRDVRQYSLLWQKSNHLPCQRLNPRYPFLPSIPLNQSKTRSPLKDRYTITLCKISENDEGGRGGRRETSIGLYFSLNVTWFKGSSKVRAYWSLNEREARIAIRMTLQMRSQSDKNKVQQLLVTPLFSLLILIRSTGQTIKQSNWFSSANKIRNPFLLDWQ